MSPVLRILLAVDLTLEAVSSSDRDGVYCVIIRKLLHHAAETGNLLEHTELYHPVSVMALSR
jgi:hypothetical protein